jgi:hypothetical protein
MFWKGPYQPSRNIKKNFTRSGRKEAWGDIPKASLTCTTSVPNMSTR